MTRRFFFASKKAQTSTEFVVMLIIGLIIVSILVGLFLDTGSFFQRDETILEQSYFQSQVVQLSSLNATSQGVFFLLKNTLNENITISHIWFDDFELGVGDIILEPYIIQPVNTTLLTTSSDSILDSEVRITLNMSIQSVDIFENITFAAPKQVLR